MMLNWYIINFYVGNGLFYIGAVVLFFKCFIVVMYIDLYLNRLLVKKMFNLLIYFWFNECVCSEKFKILYLRCFLSELFGIFIIFLSILFFIFGRFSGLKRRLILSIDIIEGNFRRFLFF